MVSGTSMDTHCGQPVPRWHPAWAVAVKSLQPNHEPPFLINERKRRRGIVKGKKSAYMYSNLHMLNTNC